MLLSLRNDHKQHLSLLFNQSAEVVEAFCNLATEFLQIGHNLKLYNTAAHKLEVDPEDVQNCIYGLVFLVIESCTHKLDEIDFRDSVLTVGFTPDQQTILSEFYLSEREDISEILSEYGGDDYHDLNWHVGVPN